MWKLRKVNKKTRTLEKFQDAGSLGPWSCRDLENHKRAGRELDGAILGAWTHLDFHTSKIRQFPSHPNVWALTAFLLHYSLKWNKDTAVPQFKSVIALHSDSLWYLQSKAIKLFRILAAFPGVSTWHSKLSIQPNNHIGDSRWCLLLALIHNSNKHLDGLLKWPFQVTDL